MTVVHLPGNLVFRDIRAPILDTYSRLEIVEVAAVQLEEFYQHHPKIDVRVGRVFPRMKLKGIFLFEL